MNIFSFIIYRIASIEDLLYHILSGEDGMLSVGTFLEVSDEWLLKTLGALSNIMTYVTICDPIQQKVHLAIFALSILQLNITSFTMIPNS